MEHAERDPSACPARRRGAPREASASATSDHEHDDPLVEAEVERDGIPCILKPIQTMKKKLKATIMTFHLEAEGELHKVGVARKKALERMSKKIGVSQGGVLRRMIDAYKGFYL